MAEQYFRPRNWAKYQSKSNNSMSWVKVQTSILSDYDFNRLTEIQQLLWLKLLLFFRVTARPQPWDSAFIARELNMDYRGIAKGLKALQASNFIELCNRTQNLHDELMPLEKSREEKSRKKESPNGDSKKIDGFEEFWRECPKRVGKKATKAEYERAVKAGTSEAELLDGMRRYATHCRANNTESQYIVHPERWLKKGRWNDEYQREPSAGDILDACAETYRRRDRGSGDEANGADLHQGSGEPGEPAGIRGNGQPVRSPARGLSTGSSGTGPAEPRAGLDASDLADAGKVAVLHVRGRGGA